LRGCACSGYLASQNPELLLSFTLHLEKSDDVGSLSTSLLRAFSALLRLCALRLELYRVSLNLGQRSRIRIVGDVCWLRLLVRGGGRSSVCEGGGEFGAGMVVVAVVVVVVGGGGGRGGAVGGSSGSGSGGGGRGDCGPAMANDRAPHMKRSESRLANSCKQFALNARDLTVV
jgi:hypothetical protein